jgi:hypothetical protein
VGWTVGGALAGSTFHFLDAVNAEPAAATVWHYQIRTQQTFRLHPYHVL